MERNKNCDENGIIGNRNPAHLMRITVGGGLPVLQIAVTLLTL
jgi:hypothetical protein